jgi:pimeloyl-ACP methyl ester carboxylesterase
MIKRLVIGLLAGAFILGACSGGGDAPSGCFDPGLSKFGSDFQNFLNNSGNSDLTGFGGSSSKSGDCAISKQPVIFIHGNGDTADGSEMAMGGWEDSRNYFIDKGYKPSELYAVNYGIAGMSGASLNYHSPENLSKINRFIKAVLDYTGAAKVDVIAHSLGVTATRRAVKGGQYSDYTGTSVNMTTGLQYKIDTFVGAAGANKGLNSCGVWPLNVWAPTCGPHGFAIGNPFFDELGSFKAGNYNFGLISYADQLTCAPMMPTTCYVYGVHTSKVPGANGNKSFYSYPYGHMGLKNETAYYQYKMVTGHSY